VADHAGEFKVAWYRVPVDRQTMRELTRRSDGKGLLQVVPWLGLLVLTGAAALYAGKRLPLAAWREIIAILRRQEREPGYQHACALPPSE